MDNLTRRALARLLWFHLVLAGLIFVPALSLAFWQGWLYWGIFLVGNLAITLYFLKHDPSLVERRMKAGPAAEHRPSQKLILRLAGAAGCAVIVVSALDHLFAWSAVPSAAVLGGDALIVMSFAIFFAVLRENSFASATIEVAAGQKVVATGPYTLVRHPMYAGAFLLFFATPIALGSWLGLLPAILLACVIILRLLDEERYLDRNLPGYEAYRRKVRSRLVPFVW